MIHHFQHPSEGSVVVSETYDDGRSIQGFHKVRHQISYHHEGSTTSYRLILDTSRQHLTNRLDSKMPSPLDRLLANIEKYRLEANEQDPHRAARTEELEAENERLKQALERREEEYAVLLDNLATEKTRHRSEVSIIRQQIDTVTRAEEAQRLGTATCTLRAEQTAHSDLIEAADTTTQSFASARRESDSRQEESERDQADGLDRHIQLEGVEGELVRKDLMIQEMTRERDCLRRSIADTESKWEATCKKLIEAQLELFKLREARMADSEETEKLKGIIVANQVKGELTLGTLREDQRRLQEELDAANLRVQETSQDLAGARQRENELLVIQQSQSADIYRLEQNIDASRAHDDQIVEGLHAKLRLMQESLEAETSRADMATRNLAASQERENKLIAAGKAYAADMARLPQENNDNQIESVSAKKDLEEERRKSPQLPDAESHVRRALMNLAEFQARKGRWREMCSRQTLIARKHF